MGWIHDGDSTSTWHEAHLVAEFPDGSRGIGISTGGTYAAGEVIVGVEYVGEPGAITDEVYATRPAATAVGWRIICDCTEGGDSTRRTKWISELLPRVPSQELEDLSSGRFHVADAADVDDLDEIKPYDQAVRAIWERDHLHGITALEQITAVRRGIVDAEQALSLAVARARSAGSTWEAIGRAAGMTRQSAQERWGKRATSC
ncbi:hypothetical protein ACLM5J_19745 [Nocardioides sp. Bht2]|uniref:hypothetical protein n=1 Tax=Nocardioides sp. Bht2 TaxID=3392297 RepID=UPI0039B4EFD5